ncbi:hypothetical protein SDC9_109252 [bioreactor metagenome]|uniref:Uncharacterized protein n=1 Tax=bioreactor metagenome TaxID=1076179 RepID=A0A645BCK9_9ZZZZ
MHLDQGGHAEFGRQLMEPAELLVIEGCHDQQNEICAVGTRFVDLVRLDGEVLAQDRLIDPPAHQIQIGQRAAEATLLGQDRDRRRTTPGIGEREFCRVGDLGECPLGRAGSFDLADDRQLRCTKCRHRIADCRCGLDLRDHLIERGPRLTVRQVVADAGDDLVEHGAHASSCSRSSTLPALTDRVSCLPARETAPSTAAALFWVSRSSLSGTESATIPAPACT